MMSPLAKEFISISILMRSKSQLVTLFHFVRQALSVTGNIYYPEF